MKKKVKTFFHVFVNSLIPNAPYYSKIRKTNFSFSLKYFVFFILILNFIFIISIVIKFNPIKVNNFLTGIISNLDNLPDNTNIAIKKGVLISNFNRPYFLWANYQDKNKLVLVLDETASPQKINTYKSFSLLTGRELVIENHQNSEEFSIIPFNYIGNQTINKSKIKIFTNILQGILIFFPFIFLGVLIALVIAIPILSLFINIVYLSTISFIIFVFFKIFITKKIHFNKTLQVSFHAATLPLILDYFLIIYKPAIMISNPLSIPLKQISSPLAFVILLAIFIFAGLYESYLDAQK